MTPLLVEPGLLAMLRIFARVRGWTLEEAARQLHANFMAFYGDALAAAAGEGGG